MFKRKSKTGKSSKLVWRISAAAPLGEYVQSEQPAVAGAPAEATATSRRPRHESHVDETEADVSERGWHQSSMDLAEGMDIIEEPQVTGPGGLPDPRIRKRP